jgi:hypothetical protein
MNWYKTNQEQNVDLPIHLWLDDVRPMPTGFNVWAINVQEAIMWLKEGNVVEISLDHDLGPKELNGEGIDVAKYIEEAAFKGELKPLKWYVHSANPVGANNMSMALKNADKFWKEHNNGLV